MFSWMPKWLGGKAPTKRDNLDFADDLHWIAASDNPWGVDILDCRSITMFWLSTSEKPEMVHSFGDLRSSDGRQHLQSEPLPHAVDGTLIQAIPVSPPEGPLFRARCMEEKWDVYHWAGTIYVARSWSGELNHTASVRCDGSQLVFDNIRSIKPDPVYARRELNFILWSHCQLSPMPAPLPVQDMPDPDHRGEKALAGWHTFTTFGRLGWFATNADMTEQPEVSREALKPWLDAHPPKPSRKRG